MRIFNRKGTVSKAVLKEVKKQPPTKKSRDSPR